ncbi:MAG: glycosyltransferase family 4 protein [Planctomycetota bacterium]|nr:glycosyltransferase family 4 protein [Planctomycetota bacterium]
MRLSVCYLLSRLPLGECGVLVGGSATNSVSLAFELKRQGVPVNIVAPISTGDIINLKGHPLEEIMFPIPITKTSLVSRGISSVIALRGSIKKLMREKGYNVVHSHSGTYPYALATLAVDGRSCARLHSLYCPLGATGGVYSGWWERPLVARHIFNRLDRVVGVSDNVYRSILGAGVSESKLNLNTMSVDTMRFRPREKNTEPRYFKGREAVRILFIGNGSVEKGLIDLLQAVGSLIGSGYPIELVGTLENASSLSEYREGEETARKFISKNGLDGCVTLTGLVGSIEELYAEADIVVVPWKTSRGPSDYPMVILEGMAMGKCIVSTPVGGCRELLGDGKAGLLTGGFGTKHIEDALARIVKNPEERAAMGRAALSESSKLSIELSARRMISLYESILSEKVYK